MTAAEELFVSLAGSDPVMQGLLGGIVIAGMNMLGALLILVWRDPSKRSLDTLLGFAAGVMLAASFTSLILPGIEAAGGNPIPVLAGFVIGVVVLDQADLWIPHVHILVTGKTRADAPETDKKMASVILFIVAITIHNMPEGLAVGVGFGSGDLGTAIPLMLAIGIQNIPEGLAVSIAAVNAGLRNTTYATFAGIRAGLVEIPLAVFGAWAVQYAAALLPYAMGFAAGAMLFVISDEIVPETHSNGHERVATFGTMLGVVVMLYLDVTLG
ncbi:ZIP family metal transporter [Haloferax denitrificans]|uniref:ZIP family metal transporter n=1 Tax=Haloferax denitrificans TaxID=35745 RepID=UPI0006781417|nr:ZIP family metal transporter [Haloferax denitrificans]